MASAGQDARVVQQLDGPQDQDRPHEHRQQHLCGCRLGQGQSNNPTPGQHCQPGLRLAATYAGTTWGLGRTWVRLPFVNGNRWAV